MTDNNLSVSTDNNDNDESTNTTNLELLIESCKPIKKRGRPSHKRQLQEIRDEKVINLQTSDSVVVATNLRSILSLEALQSLPKKSQETLVNLLPKFDQTKTPDGLLQPTKTALNNEYFARFCSLYVEKLSDNKLSEDAIEQAKQDTNRELGKLDPWKLRNYEPIWGQKLVSQVIDDEDDDKMLDLLIAQVIKNKRSLKRTKEKTSSTISISSRRKMKK